MSRYNTIALRCPQMRLEEDAVNATVYPGYLLKRDVNGAVGPHSPLGGPHEKAFAYENRIGGQTVDTPYSTTDLNLPYPYYFTSRAQYIVPDIGDLVAFRLQAGARCVNGQEMISAGDGTLIPATAANQNIVCVAQESFDNSASPYNTLVKGRVSVGATVSGESLTTTTTHDPGTTTTTTTTQEAPYP